MFSQARANGESTAQANEDAEATRVALLPTLVGIGFLCAYMLFHALHVADRDPQFMRRLSTIPLFATCGAASLAAFGTGLLGTLGVLDQHQLHARLPKVLALSALLFTAEIVLFPQLKSSAKALTAPALRLIEHIHGHLGWLATLALVHPAVLLRSGRRRSLLAATLATALASVTALLGAFLYPSYRSLLKPQIWASSPAIGNTFERKEHLAMAVVVLAWVGFLAHWSECRAPMRPRPALSVAFVAYTVAALLATATATMGLAVAVYRSF